MPIAKGSGSPLLERRRGFEPRKILDVAYSHPLSIPSGRRIYDPLRAHFWGLHNKGARRRDAPKNQEGERGMKGGKGGNVGFPTCHPYFTKS